jgi:MFS family permease
MSTAGPPKLSGGKGIPWYVSIIPLNMAVGASSVLSTLMALALGASVAEIGLMVSSGAIATIISSTVWGKLSDRSGRRKIYLVIIFLLLGPTFLVLSTAGSVPQLILYYTILSILTSGIAPIAVMFSVETCRGKNWQIEVARFNSISSLGNILGFAMNTFVALFIQINGLFYISSALCLVAVVIFWLIAEETHITLERHAFLIIHLKDAERFFSPRSIFHYLDIRQLKVPWNLKRLKPLHLLFLACFVQWTGVFFFNVGQTPLMKDLGLSDSIILAINALASAVPVITFSRIAPSLKQNHKKIINTAIFSRGFLMLCWGALPIFLIYPFRYVSVFPLLFSLLFPFFYSILWLPITTFAISSAPENNKGSAQGELLSAMAVANALGSALGGLVITTMGYTVGFIVAAIISVIAAPVISRINMI